METCGPHVDFATVNVSSPNTEKLRDLQGADALRGLLMGVLEARAAAAPQTRVFLKIAPDLTQQELTEIAQVAQEVGIDAIIATNTTLSREGLSGPHQDESGGLSGAPLFEKSTRVLAQLSTITEGKIPLIGVGGVSNAAEAYAKFRAGASAVQLYSALVYQGMSLVEEIVRGVDQHLEADGFSHISQAVGTERAAWL
jgi:dihydroorotate dehydrogenase